MAETVAETVYVGLGSNTADAEDRLLAARAKIAQLPCVRLLATSSVYATEPQGYREQPWFANCVLGLEVTGVGPDAFLAQLLELETALGRVRDPKAPRFGPRSIDIDVLLFGKHVQESAFCTLPHPRMLERAFVLYPLAEIAPNLCLHGLPLASYLDRLHWRKEGLRLYQSPTA